MSATTDDEGAESTDSSKGDGAKAGSETGLDSVTTTLLLLLPLKSVGGGAKKSDEKGGGPTEEELDADASDGGECGGGAV